MPTPNTPTIHNLEALHLAAVGRERVRLHGTIVSSVDGWRSRYRQALITIDIGCAQVQFTASLRGALAQLRPDTSIVVDVSMTGLVNVAEGLYVGERVRLIESCPRPRG